MDIKEWLFGWFGQHSSFSAADLAAASNKNYLDAGIIDSFAFVQLLSDIDDEYDIVFTNDDFLDPRFSSIDGLALMIGERIV